MKTEVDIGVIQPQKKTKNKKHLEPPEASRGKKVFYNLWRDAQLCR